VVALAVLLTFRTSRVPRRFRDVVRVAVAVTVLTAIAVALGGVSQACGAVLTLMSLLILACPFPIGWKIAHHVRVTGQTILGALSIYVHIGLIFANADCGLQLVSGNSFFAQSGQHGPSDFVDDGYIIIATVGYGDLLRPPGCHRTYAVSEALTGQIFLVVLVARLVFLYAPIHGWRDEIRENAVEGGAPGPRASGRLNQGVPGSRSRDGCGVCPDHLEADGAEGVRGRR
jgi:hypothetical protein